MNYSVILIMGMFLFGCGGGTYKEDVKPGGGGGAPPSEQQAKWDNNVKPIVTANCALAGCHATAAFVKSPAAFLASASKARVASGNMPRGRVLSAAQKAIIAGF